MKNLLCLFFLLTSSLLFSQQILVENASNYLGYSNYQVENSKSGASYFYNIVLNDSIRFADTVFRNTSGKARTLLIKADKDNQLLWFIDLPADSYKKSYKFKNLILQLIDFTDTVFEVKNKKLTNPDGETSFCLVMIDSNGLNPNLVNLGHSFKDSVLSSLYYNGYTINSSGNIVMSGYQLGSMYLDGTTYYNDTFMAKYFVYEMDLNGNVLAFDYLFKCDNPYLKISDCIENGNKLIFETSFDSLLIDNKTFTSTEILGYTLNDLALIVFDKNSRSLSSYTVVFDSFANSLSAIDPITSIGQTILWSVNSSVRYIKVKDSVYLADYDHENFVFLIDINTGQPISKYALNEEIESIPFDFDYINEQNYVITFRNPGSFVKINNQTFPFSVPNVTAFIVIEPLKSPKLIYQVNGNAYSFKLTAFTESRMEFFVNYFAKNANILFKTLNVGPNSEINNWKFQTTFYSLENFSRINKTEQVNINLFPNPANDVLYFSITHSTNAVEKVYDITIYDALGNVVSNQLVFENYIDLSSFYSGIYFIEIKSDDISIYKKFIIAK